MSKIFLREMLILSQNLSRRFIDGEIVNILGDKYEKDKFRWVIGPQGGIG